MENFQHRDTELSGCNFLSVTRFKDRFSIVAFQSDFFELTERNVLCEIKLEPRQTDVMQAYLDVDPLDCECSLPSRGAPAASIFLEIDWCHHLRNATEIASIVHTEEQINRTFVGFEGAIKTFIAPDCTAPNIIFDGSKHVVFGKGFNDEKASIICVKLFEFKNCVKD